uniref:Uncharacterized protein n=1 Tax=Anguilla anguilla TaxID=7936 RepID=A0A0E9WAB1_ANGAN
MTVTLRVEHGVGSMAFQEALLNNGEASLTQCEVAKLGEKRKELRVNTGFRKIKLCALCRQVWLPNSTLLYSTVLKKRDFKSFYQAI